MVKDEFFQTLQETVGSVVRSDVMIVMGDFNARVGNATSTWVMYLVAIGKRYAMRMGSMCCSSAMNTIS